MNNLEKLFYRQFKKGHDCLVRNKEGLTHDHIHAGIYHKNLLSHGFTNKDINKGVKEGYLGEHHIRMKNGEVRLVYAYLPVIFGQTGYKKWLDKIKTFFGRNKDESNSRKIERQSAE